MYPCSEAFHEAVRNGNEQKALLIFSDCVFTDADIRVDSGIRFNEYFNMTDDLSIGQVNSNEIAFSLFNDDRLLNDYAFGDFLATLGVHISTGIYIQYGSVMIETTYGRYIGSADYPFITRNGIALGVQPSFAVRSLLSYDGKVWAFSNDGRYAVYRDSTGENITGQNPLNDFMKKKSTTWNGKGIVYNKDTRILLIYEAGKLYEYEFVPLGWFTAERPKAPDKIQLDFSCYDYMLKFEEDMPSASALRITYPVTIGELFVKMCDYLHIKYKTSRFINSTAVIKKEPNDFSNVTMREVLKWIAEAAGSNARFDRDGVLVLDWLRNTTQTYEATGYTDFNPYWYKTKKVTKLYNRDTQDVDEKTVGTGDEGYLIQDNPLLKGVN